MQGTYSYASSHQARVPRTHVKVKVTTWLVFPAAGATSIGQGSPPVIQTQIAMRLSVHLAYEVSVSLNDWLLPPKNVMQTYHACLFKHLSLPLIHSLLVSISFAGFATWRWRGFGFFWQFLVTFGKPEGLKTCPWQFVTTWYHSCFHTSSSPGGDSGQKTDKQTWSRTFTQIVVRLLNLHN